MLSIAGVIGASCLSVPASPSPKRARRYYWPIVRRITGGYDYADVGGNGGCPPDTGSFSTYADKAIGRWAGIPSAGCTGGFGYWLSHLKPTRRHDPALVGSRHSHLVIFPLITLALTGSNLLSVKNYGEFSSGWRCVKSSLSWPLFSLVHRN